MADTEREKVGGHLISQGKNDLTEIQAELVAAPVATQRPLFHIEKQIEIDGVEMGVLDSGIPFLTERGLARMTGVGRTAINRMAVGWAEEKLKPRGRQIAELLEQNNYTEEVLFLESENNGVRVLAYTEPVCLALLEYYAFVVDEPRPEALRAFRTLARTTFRTFIYGAVGYSPEHRLLDDWRHFHDRIDLTKSAVPDGHWCVFQEIAGLIVPMISGNLPISDKVIPDISVGLSWGKYWAENNLPAVHGDRVRYSHAYPDYYPQSKSNPQPAYAYPDSALPEFRFWLKKNYLVDKFPSYLLGKVGQGALDMRTVNKALASLGVKEIEVKQRAKGKLKG